MSCKWSISSEIWLGALPSQRCPSQRQKKKREIRTFSSLRQNDMSEFTDATEQVSERDLYPVMAVTGCNACIFMHTVCKQGLMFINMRNIRKFINQGHLYNSIVNFNHLFRLMSPLESQSAIVIYLFSKNIVQGYLLLDL